METVESKTIKATETILSHTAINWVNHCTYEFVILEAGSNGMAVKISRNNAIIYSNTVDYNTTVQLNVPGPNGELNGKLHATRTKLIYNGNLEENNMVMTNMIVGAI